MSTRSIVAQALVGCTIRSVLQYCRYQRKQADKSGGNVEAMRQHFSAVENFFDEWNLFQLEISSVNGSFKS